RAGRAEAVVMVDQQVGGLEVHHRRSVPGVGVVDGRILGAWVAHARLPGLAGPTPGALREPAPAVVVAPARPGRIPRAMSAAHDVDLERVAPLVHVPEQLAD